MNIGIPKEIKNMENRVGLTPAGVKEFVRHGHRVWIEREAGVGSGFSDQSYLNAGAAVVDSAEEVWAADMVCKVKEPLKEEYRHFRENLLLFTYLHLAAEAELTEALLENEVTSIAYETVQLETGSLPLLTPMSEVAGRMAVQIGVRYLEKPNGGQGILLGGVPGVSPGQVVIVGGGVVGLNAAKMASGMGAKVTILDISADRLRELDNVFNGRIELIMSNEFNLEQAVASADLLIGAVLVAGTRAPKLVSESMVKQMRSGSVIVDVAIDQGGCIETVDRVTSHSDPTYEKYGVIHYSVGNMPGAVPRTSTLALTNVTLPYAVKLADLGFRQAIQADRALARGINTFNGRVSHEGVAKSLGYIYTPVEKLL
ncbi:alanine dehydrogenase [Chloroflexi bacterium TSY]|nr:alanine dehydrogenase [Chloroflexi bacterium TSY]